MKENSYIYPNFPKELVKSELHLNRYLKFIDSRPIKLKKTKEIYTENHHKIPKALGGNNDKENMILLTAREHFIAHLILWKTFRGSMALAFKRMITSKQNGSKEWITSKQYEKVRIDHSEYISKILTGRYVSQKTRDKIKKAKKENPYHPTKETIEKTARANRGKHHSEETKRKMSKSGLGRAVSQETRDKIKKTKKENPYHPSKEAIEKTARANRGRKHTEEAKRKISEAGKGRVKSPESIQKTVDFHTGRKRSKETCKNISNSQTGMKYVNDGIKNKRVKPEDVQYWLDKGYFKGRKSWGCHTEETREKIMKNLKRKKVAEDFLMLKS